MSMKLKKKVKELTGDDATQASQIQVLQADVGSDDTTAGGLKKRCKDIETAIGDDTTANTILGRIKALEDAQNPTTTQD